MRPPLPPATGARGWGIESLTRLYEACLGLYLALLGRWRSPLVVPGSEPGSLRLADGYLRNPSAEGQSRL